jgi:hypothetical protein
MLGEFWWNALMLQVLPDKLSACGTLQRTSLGFAWVPPEIDDEKDVYTPSSSSISISDID